MSPLSRSHFAVVPALALSLALLATTGCNRDPNVRKQKYLESGKRYEKDGKYREAAIQFANALKVDRNFADAHFEMGKTYLQMGTPTAAYAELVRAVDLAPTNAQARLELGNLEVAGGLPDKATEQARALLAMNPNNADAYGLLSNIAIRKGDKPEALKQIQQALTLNPGQAKFHTTLALLEGAEPQGGAAAEQELQKAISLDSKDANAHIVLATLLEKKGDQQGAEQQALSAVQQDPKNLQARQTLANIYVKAGDQAKLEQTLRQTSEDFSETEHGAEILSTYYLRTGQANKAVTAYAEMVDKNPKSVPLKLVYAKLLVLSHNDAKAQGIVDDLNKSNSKNPEVKILSASLLIDAGKMNEAADVLQKASHDSPDSVPLQLALGKISLRRGDLGTAETAFREAAKRQPANLEAQTGLAEFANAKNDPSLLRQVAEKTISINPDFPESYVWRATAEANEKQYDKAEADLQTALSKKSNNPQIFVELGQLRMVKGKSAEGIAMLEKALELDPGSTAALGQIASYDVVALHQPDKAVARVKQQIAKVPQKQAFYNQLAMLQLGTKDFAGARDAAQKAMQMNSADQQAVGLYAQAESALGNSDAAINAWQQWSGAHPKDASAVSMVGLLQENKGDTSKAMDSYKKALAIDPGQMIASNNLAYLMVENGQSVDAALTLAQDARRSMPNSPSTADTLAWVLYYKGRYESARDLLEEAVKDQPADPSIQYHLGMTYSKMGDRTNAVLHLKKAAELAPNAKAGKDASAALAQLG